ncbi:MAG: hypothetical protein RR835_08480 [Peptostreptococcaceae bacterium]
MNKSKIVLSTKYGDINGDSYPEKITLVGTPFDENSVYIQNLQLIIEHKSTAIQTFNIPINGYVFNLALVDVLKNNFEQMIITGQYGGSGGFAIFRLYEYKDDKLNLILSDETLSNQINCYGTYEKNKTISISCLETNKLYTIDIKNNPKVYLDLIYDENGNIVKNLTPIISDVNTVYPILAPYNKFYSLQVQQRIIGISNSDTLGILQSIIEVNKKGKISIKEQYVIKFVLELD